MIRLLIVFIVWIRKHTDHVKQEHQACSTLFSSCSRPKHQVLADKGSDSIAGLVTWTLGDVRMIVFQLRALPVSMTSTFIDLVCRGSILASGVFTASLRLLAVVLSVSASPFPSGPHQCCSCTHSGTGQLFSMVAFCRLISSSNQKSD